MSMNLFAVVVVVLGLLAAIMFVLKRDLYELREAQKGLGREISALFDITERANREIEDMKVQRDELEREERKVLEGMNNIMNYGLDVARKAARDGGEG